MPPDVARPRRRWWSVPSSKPRRLVLRPLAATAFAVVLLAAGIGLGAWLDRDSTPVGQLALEPVGDLDPGASGNIAVSDDGVTVRVSGLQPTEDDQFYELWLLGADKELVGLGSFRVGEDGAATLKLPLPMNPDAFQYFDLSLEPGDGDPGHSGVSVLRGPTAA
jgi:anti-sigma-K factor RskA